MYPFALEDDSCLVCSLFYHFYTIDPDPVRFEQDESLQHQTSVSQDPKFICCMNIFLNDHSPL